MNLGIEVDGKPAKLPQTLAEELQMQAKKLTALQADVLRRVGAAASRVRAATVEPKWPMRHIGDSPMRPSIAEPLPDFANATTVEQVQEVADNMLGWRTKPFKDPASWHRQGGPGSWR